MTFILSLYEGKFGFAKTFWVFYALIGIVLLSLNSIIGMTSALTTNSYLVVLINALISSYLIVSLIGVWRSSNHYSGSQILVILSKIIVVANFAGQVLMLGTLFVLGFEYLVIYFSVLLLVISVLNSKSNL
jgi:hypothetical protein